MVGLYLDPPDNAIVLCVDEKSQIQALNRTAPILPLRPGLPGEGDARLPAQWHDDAVRRARDGDPAGSPSAATSGMARPSSGTSSSAWRAPIRVRSCTSCSTTITPTSMPTSNAGWPATRALELRDERPSGPWRRERARRPRCRHQLSLALAGQCRDDGVDGVLNSQARELGDLGGYGFAIKLDKGLASTG